MFIQIVCVFVFVFFLVSDLRSESADTRTVIGSKIQAFSDARETHDPEIRRLLDHGDFDEALGVYRKRLRIEPTDPVLNRKFEELRSVSRLRQELSGIECSTRRNILSGQLRRFYLQNGCYRENIVQALKNFDVQPNEKNALFVIEAYDFTESYRESLAFIDTLDAGEQIRIEKCRILLLDGRPAEAVTVLQSLSVEEIDSPDLLCRLSRLQALTGQDALAVKILARSFELMPLNRLDAIKNEINRDPAFRAIRSMPEYTALMKFRSREPACAKPCPCRLVNELLDDKLNYMKMRYLGEIDLNFWRVN